MRLFRRLVYWWRFDPQVSWKWLSTLSQIPNDQMRAGSARATGVSDRLVTTASRNGVRVTVIALSRGNRLMGCDIHCYIEHKRVGTEHWWSYGGRINPGRNYAVFERLAGVRGDDAQAIAPPRGLPERLAWNAHGDQWLFITDDSESEEYASTEEAARYVKHGGTYLYQDGTDKPPTHVSAPDWHSHSWVTPDEWQTAISTARYEVGVEYRAMLASMRAMEREGHEVRVVFWFDN